MCNYKLKSLCVSYNYDVKISKITYFRVNTILKIYVSSLIILNVVFYDVLYDVRILDTFNGVVDIGEHSIVNLLKG
jgi:hypothetical protein